MLPGAVRADVLGMAPAATCSYFESRQVLGWGGRRDALSAGVDTQPQTSGNR